MVYAIENHPHDSRVKIYYDGIVQALSARMGTGGGNVPLVLIVTESHYDDWHEDDMSNTLRASGATQVGWTSSHCKYRGPEL